MSPSPNPPQLPPQLDPAASDKPTATKAQRERLECKKDRREDEGPANFATAAASLGIGAVMVVKVLAYLLKSEWWTAESSFMSKEMKGTFMLLLGLAFGVTALLSAMWFPNAFGNEDPVRDPTWLKEMRVVQRTQMALSGLFLVSLVAAALIFLKLEMKFDSVTAQLVGVYMLVLHLGLVAVTSTLVHYSDKYGKFYYNENSLVRPSEKSRNWDVCLTKQDSTDCAPLKDWCE